MYRILFTQDYSRHANDPVWWMKDMTMFYVEIPFVRQHPNEWIYLQNWHAKRDKNYMNAEKAPDSWKQTE